MLCGGKTAPPGGQAGGQLFPLRSFPLRACLISPCARLDGGFSAQTSLIIDLYLLVQRGAGGLYYLLLGLAFLWVIFTLVYLFPLIVRYENTLLGNLLV